VDASTGELRGLVMMAEKLAPKTIDAYLGAVDWLIGLLNREEVSAAWAQPS
jgi:hypothetical protein